MKQFFTIYFKVALFSIFIISIFLVSDVINIRLNNVNSQALNLKLNTSEVDGNKLYKIKEINKMIKAEELKVSERYTYLLEKAEKLNIDVSKIAQSSLSQQQVVTQLELLLNENPIEIKETSVPELCFESIDLATQYADLEIQKAESAEGDIGKYSERNITIIDYEITNCQSAQSTSKSGYSVFWIDDNYNKHPILK